jgi:hypothetical protein
MDRALERDSPAFVNRDAESGRRERLQRVDVTFGEEPKRWQLEVRPDASEAQKQRLEKWER